VAYPDELLVAGEQVVLHRHPHVKMLFLPVLVLLVVVGLAVFGSAVLAAQPWALIAWIAIAVVALVIVVPFSLVPVLRWRTTHFVVTTRRVLVRSGIISRSGIDIPMSRINTVQFRHTVLERLLGCGTLAIESASDEPLEFTDIPDVEYVHSLLYQEVADDR
jgi:uncharacterized membrane protein YdbT with pleckstrin-like domain